MAVRQPRHSKEVFAQRGNEIYESQVRLQVEADNYGKIVAIDIETGAFEVADDLLRVIGILCKSGSKERICVDSNTQYTKF
jgi:hypothetical protein